MALKATIYKSTVQLADMDRNLYGDYELTIARHPSETDERLLIRLVAFALNVPANPDDGRLEFAKDMWDADEPALWRKSLTGDLEEWIEVGQPDEKRLLQCCGRSRHVTVYSFASSASQWWSSMGPKISSARNLAVWQIPAKQSQALAELANRTMKIDVTVQDGTIWMGDGGKSLEVSPVRLLETAPR
jgi:uncharacterized protein YaeQ